MKASKKEQEFQPITITLETRKEADILWHILNNCPAYTFNKYVEDHNLIFDEGIKDEMWKVLNKVHYTEE